MLATVRCQPGVKPDAGKGDDNKLQFDVTFYLVQGLGEAVKFQPGVPVKPMLAKPMTGVSEVLDKFSDKPFTCEFKYDGERAQVHILEGVTYFT